MKTNLWTSSPRTKRYKTLLQNHYKFLMNRDGRNEPLSGSLMRGYILNYCRVPVTFYIFVQLLFIFDKRNCLCAYYLNSGECNLYHSRGGPLNKSLLQEYEQFLLKKILLVFLIIKTSITTYFFRGFKGNFLFSIKTN